MSTPWPRVRMMPTRRINLASALAEGGELERAIELYEEALKLKPESREAQMGLSRARGEFNLKNPTTNQRG